MPEVGEAIFNSYIYNTFESVPFGSAPLIGKETLEKVKQKPKEEDKKVTKKAEETETPGVRGTNEAIYDLYRYLMKINQNHIVEVLFVFSTLLSGKRKADLQQDLLKFPFIKQLTSLFQQIKWKPFATTVLIKSYYIYNRFHLIATAILP